jgi:hypothetical protein
VICIGLNMHKLSISESTDDARTELVGIKVISHENLAFK